jgi:hypothetical protein
VGHPGLRGPEAARLGGRAALHPGESQEAREGRVEAREGRVEAREGRVEAREGRVEAREGRAVRTWAVQRTWAGDQEVQRTGAGVREVPPKVAGAHQGGDPEVRQTGGPEALGDPGDPEALGDPEDPEVRQTGGLEASGDPEDPVEDLEAQRKDPAAEAREVPALAASEAQARTEALVLRFDGRQAERVGRAVVGAPTQGAPMQEAPTQEDPTPAGASSRTPGRTCSDPGLAWRRWDR